MSAKSVRESLLKLVSVTEKFCPKMELVKQIIEIVVIVIILLIISVF